MPARVSFNRYQMARLTAPRRDAFYVRRPCTAISRRGQCEDNRTPPPCYLVFPVIPLFATPEPASSLLLLYRALSSLFSQFRFRIPLAFFFVTHFFSSPPSHFYRSRPTTSLFHNPDFFPLYGKSLGKIIFVIFFFCPPASSSNIASRCLFLLRHIFFFCFTSWSRR